MRKIRKTKSARDASPLMFVAFCVGVSLRLVYSSVKSEIAIIVTDTASLVFGAAVV